MTGRIFSIAPAHLSLTRREWQPERLILIFGIFGYHIIMESI